MKTVKNLETVAEQKQAEKDYDFVHSRKRFFGHSWLGWLNKIILQWFFIRLVEEVEGKEQKHIRWGLITKVYPLSGWGTSYKFIGEK